jgi:hypothetical protein
MHDIEPSRAEIETEERHEAEKEDRCPECVELPAHCGCGYGSCDTCGEEWNQDQYTDCPNSAEAQGIDPEEEPEAAADCCEGSWVHWTEA